MADDETRRGPPDRKRLNKDAPCEVAYGTRSASARTPSAESAAILSSISDSLFSAKP